MGTESVEVSEKLSRILKQNKLEHTVLNAKQHAKEAEIIAHAGRRGAITIATNMAGRGTDIKLETGVAALGGLYVIGTTRHQSRRTDRQLRGRSARQGDPGESIFYISFEDQLLRLFSSPRITALLQRFRPGENEPISSPLLNKSIEQAQKRVEQRNSMMRKHTLEYDDVMNKQRQEIYAFRNEILSVEDIVSVAVELLENVCTTSAMRFFQSHSEEGRWDPEGYRQWLIAHFPVSFIEGYFDKDGLDLQDIEKLAAERIVNDFREKIARERKKIPSMPLLPSGEKRPDPVEGAVRNLMIREIDHLWQEHLLTMDHLRTDVNLRAVAQRDPLTEFKQEAFILFEELSHQLRDKIARNLFRFEIVGLDPLHLQRFLKEMHLETNRSFLTDLEVKPETPPPPSISNGSARQESAEGYSVDSSSKSEPVHVPPKIGRNEDCPCGSGKKYKKCCGLQQDILESSG